MSHQNDDERIPIKLHGLPPAVIDSFQHQLLIYEQLSEEEQRVYLERNPGFACTLRHVVQSSLS